MSKIKGKIVMITGGASGIGRLMGEMALEKGAKALVIWDINQESIDATVKELGKKGTVHGYRVDVSRHEMVAEQYDEVKKEVGDVDILINSAGSINAPSMAIIWARNLPIILTFIADLRQKCR